ncbi:MAG TPA: phosphoribosyltransferase family protein [Pirellulales bacterium]|nr:phosphoribosyltransferase family protein [Pirellulales bacterium]
MRRATLREIARGGRRLGAAAGRTIQSAALGVSRLLLTPRCAFCAEDFLPGAPDQRLCLRCRAELLQPPLSRCLRCAAPLPLLSTASADGCAQCNDRLWRLDLAWTLGDYRNLLRAAILQTKNPHGSRLARELGRLLGQACGEQLAKEKFEAVVPIPLHWTRRLKRGFSGPELIAGELSRALKVPLEARLLRRRRTVEIKFMSRSRRAQSLQGVFSVSSAYELKNARILLVDDILTTGGTCNEAARALHWAGADYVGVAVVARAARPR